MLGRCGRGLGSFRQGDPPWEGNQFGPEITCSKRLPQDLEVRLTYPFQPLQRLPEAIFEILLEQAKEGGGEGE